MKPKFLIFPLATVLFVYNVSTLAQTAVPESQVSQQANMQSDTDFNAAGRSAKIEKSEHILEILNVVSNNAINAANEALQRSRNPAVRNYATNIKAEHSTNLRRRNAIAQRLGIVPAPSPLSTFLQRSGRIELNQLASTSPRRFDADYIQAMIKDNKNTLSVIDNVLLPKAKKPILAMHLQATRNTVENHLNTAEQIAGKLNSY